MLDSVLFFLFGAVAVVGAGAMITRRNTIHSAVCFLVTLLAIAGIFLQLRAEFLFAAQIMLFAGGIAALLLFVTLFLGQHLAPEPWRFSIGKLVAGLVALALGLAFATLLLWAGRLPGEGLFVPKIEDADKLPPNSEALAKSLFSNYLLSFEITGVVLLVSMIGAVVMVRNKKGES